MTKARYKQHIK